MGIKIKGAFKCSKNRTRYNGKENRRIMPWWLQGFGSTHNVNHNLFDAMLFVPGLFFWGGEGAFSKTVTLPLTVMPFEGVQPPPPPRLSFLNWVTRQPRALPRPVTRANFGGFAEKRISFSGELPIWLHFPAGVSFPLPPLTEKAPARSREGESRRERCRGAETFRVRQVPWPALCYLPPRWEREAWGILNFHSSQSSRSKISSSNKLSAFLVGKCFHYGMGRESFRRTEWSLLFRHLAKSPPSSARFPDRI